METNRLKYTIKFKAKRKKNMVTGYLSSVKVLAGGQNLNTINGKELTINADFEESDISLLP